MKSYKCPACKETQRTVLSWENAPIAYEVNLQTGKNVGSKIDGTSEFQQFSCPGCGENLPKYMERKISKMLGW